MRRLSFTRDCPMNSASRCGRRDSSTTDSSGSSSGVVISVRDMRETYRPEWLLRTARPWQVGPRLLPPGSGHGGLQHHPFANVVHRKEAKEPVVLHHGKGSQVRCSQTRERRVHGLGG